MNTEITLRDMLITPLPDLSAPEYSYDGDPWSTTSTLIHNPNWVTMRTMITDAASWTARAYAETLNYISDSTMDTHHALITLINDLHNIIYGDDQTIDFHTALTNWLDNPDNTINFYTATFSANLQLIDAAGPMPALFTHFDSNDDRLYDYDN